MERTMEMVIKAMIGAGLSHSTPTSTYLHRSSSIASAECIAFKGSLHLGKVRKCLRELEESGMLVRDSRIGERWAHLTTWNTTPMFDLLYGAEP